MAKQIVIEINGGMSCEIYSDDPDIEVVLIDWDTTGFDLGDHFIHEIEDGLTVLVVPEYPTTRTGKLSDQTLTALQRAGLHKPILGLTPTDELLEAT
jgi:hypothetical protein